VPTLQVNALSADSYANHPLGFAMHSAC
jgi:hypothetical protein